MGAKLKANGSGLVYSTYLGGSGTGYNMEGASAIAADKLGHAYVTGRTDSADFPTTSGAFQINLKVGYYAIDSFVAKLKADGSGLVYSTYLGGSWDETAPVLALPWMPLARPL